MDTEFYHFLFHCESPEKLNEYIAENKLGKKRSNVRNTGTRTYYRCSSIRKYPKCPAAAYAFYPSDKGDRIEVYEKCLHDHEERAPSGRLASPVRESIKALSHLKKQQVKRTLVALGHDAPPDKKLKSCMYYHRQSTSELPANLTVHDLGVFCDVRSAVPVDPHTPFVPLYDVKNRENIFMHVTTPYLSQLMARSSMLQTDCTYKLIWNDYPILICGATDMRRTFHPFGFALVSSDESTVTYTSLFVALDKANQMVSGAPHQPSVILADGCHGTTSAVSQCYPSAVRSMCWAHVLTTMLQADMRVLQLSQSRAIFDGAGQLFVQKWSVHPKPEVRKFVEYFNAQWLQALPNWFEGAAPFIPSTNNGVESLNGRVKDQNTLRQKLPLARFLEEAVKMVTEWSKESAEKGFQTTPDYEDRNVLHKAYVAQEAKVPVTEIGGGCYVVSSADPQVPLQDWMNMTQSLSWPSFDDFVKCMNSHYYVYPYNALWFCGCSIGQKQYFCKHIALAQVKSGWRGKLSDHLNVKRKVGRPKAVTPALSM